MTAIKEKAVKLIEKLPDDKIVYIVNIMEDLAILFHDTQDDKQRLQAYENLKKYKRGSSIPLDYKEELAKAMEEKYENIG